MQAQITQLYRTNFHRARHYNKIMNRMNPVGLVLPPAFGVTVVSTFLAVSANEPRCLVVGIPGVVYLAGYKYLYEKRHEHETTCKEVLQLSKQYYMLEQQLFLWSKNHK
jgi:hypothetical protein